MRLTRPALASLTIPPGRTELIIFDVAGLDIH